MPPGLTNGWWLPGLIALWCMRDTWSLSCASWSHQWVVAVGAARSVVYEGYMVFLVCLLVSLMGGGCRGCSLCGV